MGIKSLQEFDLEGLTYSKLSAINNGFLLNFNVEWIKDGFNCVLTKGIARHLFNKLTFS